jgi:uncharacterized phiE125 gp8 family phage protein
MHGKTLEQIMASPKVVTPAAHPAIPLAEVRAHLRIASDGSEDERVEDYLRAAVDEARHVTGQSIGAQTLEIALDAFPASIGLPYGPVSAVTQIQYVDQAGMLQTLSPAAYVLDSYASPARVLPAPGATWPHTMATANAVRVRYEAGSIPPSVKSALLLMVASLYENRGDAPGAFPEAVYALLNTARVY